MPEFLEILKAHGVKAIADVRRFPASRRHPHFNAESLARELPLAGIDYIRLPELGGRRLPDKDSQNMGWKNVSFRGYADYMQTSPFWHAIDKLEIIAGEKVTAVMCAELLPWKCHRSLVADAMILRKWDVQHIYDAKTVKPHKMTVFAQVEGNHIIYPKPDPIGNAPSLFHPSAH
jgi:uncharacterized protein (DUF488 family)